MSDATSHKGHPAVLIFLLALCAYGTLPVFGVGFYRNGSGQLFFQLWYLIGFMVIAFFLMHELITPLPPKDTNEGVR
ncbi:MAG: hypothetical protein ACXVID_05650 [Thermoanaerobaculia bacterium]|jgi:hypothetical protein